MLLLLQISRTFVNSRINILVFFLLPVLLIVKTAIFTGLYLGLWCEHSVETNMGVGDQLGQHIPVVRSLREFYKIEIDGLWCCVENHLLIVNDQITETSFAVSQLCKDLESSILIRVVHVCSWQ